MNDHSFMNFQKNISRKKLIFYSLAISIFFHNTIQLIHHSLPFPFFSLYLSSRSGWSNITTRCLTLLRRCAISECDYRETVRGTFLLLGYEKDTEKRKKLIKDLKELLWV